MIAFALPCWNANAHVHGQKSWLAKHILFRRRVFLIYVSQCLHACTCTCACVYVLMRAHLCMRTRVYVGSKKGELMCLLLPASETTKERLVHHFEPCETLHAASSYIYMVVAHDSKSTL